MRGRGQQLSGGQGGDWDSAGTGRGTGLCNGKGRRREGGYRRVDDRVCVSINSLDTPNTVCVLTKLSKTNSYLPRPQPRGSRCVRPPSPTADRCDVCVCVLLYALYILCVYVLYVCA